MLRKNTYPLLLIRADANETIGHGHLMRMLAVAQSCRRFGLEVKFVCINCPHGIKERFEKEKYEVILLSNRLAIGSEGDAYATNELAKALDAQAVLLDGYLFGEPFIHLLKKSGNERSVISMRDTMPEVSFVKMNDLIIYPCLAERSGMDYLPSNIRCGPDFALIRDEFTLNRERAANLKSRIEKNQLTQLLICLGGADPVDGTSTILRTLLDNVEKIAGNLKVRVILGGSNPVSSELVELAQSIKSKCECELLYDVQRMNEHYEWADAVVTAAGGMVWEWLFFGLTGGVVAIAENQERFYDDLVRLNHATGFGKLIGMARTFDEECFLQWLEKLIGTERRQNRSSSIIDGKGAFRVCEAIFGLLKYR